MLFDCCSSSHIIIITSKRIFQQEEVKISDQATLIWTGISLAAVSSRSVVWDLRKVSSRPLLSLWEGLKKCFLFDEACVEPDDDS